MGGKANKDKGKNGKALKKERQPPVNPSGYKQEFLQMEGKDNDKT